MPIAKCSIVNSGKMTKAFVVIDGTKRMVVEDKEQAEKMLHQKPNSLLLILV